MGNCYSSVKKSPAEIAPEMVKSPPVVKLYGPRDSFATSHIRLAILYKPVKLQYVPSDAHENPTVVYQSDVVSGSVEEILRYLDSKFPDPPLAVNAATALSSIWGWCGEATPTVVWVVVLQHRSINWHLERMVKWAEDLEARGGKAKGDPSMGSPRMEVKKFGKSYSHLLQVMLEHAQMEETVLFQILESQDRGLCKSANEEHGSHLPIMNGIKEQIKTMAVMNPGSPEYQETLAYLLSRLKLLRVSKYTVTVTSIDPVYYFFCQDKCRSHFEEEERELLPLMEAAEMNKSQQEKVLQQSLEAMRETHSHLYRFFMEGLRPDDAMHYFGLIKRYCDTVRVSLMLHMMVD
ncbi:hypothetical protein M569_07728 [Genlisea aurea]|uniref:Hemerythrin-like domain-containing protein n=1 Tax=Genlisea aurea TaxID=192259 RepID=S8E437_9LAMI|nr:hypothetical protein M569_07728 [Genlisea aurea]